MGDQRAKDLAEAEQECRKAINMSMKDYNLALARERKSKEDNEKQKTLEDNLTEISNQVYSDTLTENPAVAQSAFGSHRVITDRWKGMSPAEINAIRYTQQQQIEEKQRLKAEEDQMNQEWSTQTLNNSKAALLLEHQQERLQKITKEAGRRKPPSFSRAEI